MLARQLSRGLIGCAALAMSTAVFALGTGGKVNRCEAVFGTGLQAHTSGIISTPPLTAQTVTQFNSDTKVIRAVTVPTGNRCNVTGFGASRCLATGHASPTLSAGTFQGTTSTTTLTVPSQGTATVSQSQFSTVTVGQSATANFPAGTYKINTLTANSGGVINLGAGDYWIRNLSLGTSGKINVTGTGTARIFVESFTGSTGNQLNWGASPSKLVVYSYGNIPGSSSGKYSGFFYAQGTVNSNTALEIEGAVSGSQVSLGLNEQITDKSDQIPNTNFGSLCNQAVADVNDPKRVVNERSLLVNEIAVLNYNQNGQNFSLASTLNALGATLSPAITGASLAQRLWKLELPVANGGTCPTTVKESGSTFTWANICDRGPLEGRQALNAAANVGLYKPVALVNRHDLLDPRLNNQENCGEFRMVYAHDDPNTSVDADGDGNGDEGTETLLSTVRNFIIFEARMPNPNPALGAAGCKPVQNYWASLTDIEDPTVRGEKLWKFFFDGMPLAGGGKLPPILTWSNFAGDDDGSGQIRTNEFLNPVGGGIQKSWVLKEFQLSQTSPYLTQKPVNATPSPRLLDVTEPDPAVAALGVLYRQQFLTGQVNSGFNVNPTHLGNLLVTKPEGSSLTVGHLLLADNRANALKYDFSESFSTANNADTNANSVLLTRAQLGGQNSFLNQISAQLNNLGIRSTDGQTCDDNPQQSAGCFSPQQVIARAQAQTCAGCHQPTAFGLDQANAIGPGQSQPASHGLAGFVHTSGVANADGTYQISPALTNSFLPFRNGIVECFLNETLALPECTGAQQNAAFARTM